MIDGKSLTNEPEKLLPIEADKDVAVAFAQAIGMGVNGFTMHADLIAQVVAYTLLSTPAALDNTAVEGLEDEIVDALDESMDIDWTTRDGARHVIGLLRTKGFFATLTAKTEKVE